MDETQKEQSQKFEDTKAMEVLFGRFQDMECYGWYCWSLKYGSKFISEGTITELWRQQNYGGATLGEFRKLDAMDATCWTEEGAKEENC